MSSENQFKARTWGVVGFPAIYLYDGFNLLAEIDQSGNAIARYVEHTDMDEPLSELRSGITDYYEADA